MCLVLKFADNTKFAMVVESEEDKAKFQAVLDHLQAWSQDWQMLFIVSKCNIIHITHGGE